MKKIANTFLILLMGSSMMAQFHTMKIPKPSPKVVETQELGITEITVEYSTPAVRGRDVWSEIVGENGDPNLAWRAGANINTRIKFSTDVMIEGQPLKAGSYGFHIDAKQDGPWTLMFAHHDNQWGSYYLDRDKHVTLKVDVTPTSCPFSEQLDYEFIERSENSLILALEWGERRIPFKVEVDLNKTVVENFRYELLGENTYRWEAWNDAANWCLNHNTNLDEALEWANRSINGGYTGFSANKNVTNMTTKARVLLALNKTDELENTISELKIMNMTAYEANGLGLFLLRNKLPNDALEVSSNALKTNPDVWFLRLNRGLSYYFLGNKKLAIKDLEAIQTTAPEWFSGRLAEIKKEIEQGIYKISGT